METRNSVKDLQIENGVEVSANQEKIDILCSKSSSVAQNTQDNSNNVPNIADC